MTPRPSPSNKPLRRTKSDLIATGIIVMVCTLAISIVYFTAPVRHSALSAAEKPFVAEPADHIAESLSTSWTISDNTPNQPGPLTIDGVIVATDGPTIRGYTPSGNELWSYTRDKPLCSLSSAFHAAVATYRTGVGCGDVVSIDAATGKYKATRSSLSSSEVAPIASNDNVGIIGAERVELWRSDLVRTIEYGHVEAKQEPDMQPHEECSITSAKTRKKLLAVTENCPDGTSWLRIMGTTPEDSRKPEIKSEIALESTDARIVAVDRAAVAVYIPTSEPRINSYNDRGDILDSKQVPPSTFPKPPFQPADKDLPHYMSWFDGQRLTLFNPGDLTVSLTFDDAIGTGISVGDQLVYPTAEGLKVVDEQHGEFIRLIPIDREGYSGEVSLGVAGNTFVEKRGTTLVGLI